MSYKPRILTEKELIEERQRKIKEKLQFLREKEEEQEAWLKAKRFNFSYISLKGFPIDIEALSIISKEEAEKAGVIIFSKHNEELRLGIVDPTNQELKKLVKNLKTKGYSCNFYIISKVSFDYALKLYRQVIVPKHWKEEKIEVKKESLLSATTKIKNLLDLPKIMRQISLSESISLIFVAAANFCASDVHFEPQNENVLLRYRLDGVLQTIAKIPHDLYSKLLNRIKFLSGMKINITEVPQDGRFTIKLKEKEVDMRVSTLPTPFGESLVIRLLGVGAYDLTLEKLGLRPREHQILKRGISKPNGLILTTGPTGSGKTTTLYALLSEKKSPKIKIITLEDPVEYRLEGITQTQLDREKKMDFAAGLRAILRQNPDVIMVGEIRDIETAEIACQAAQTGHLVFSTLHTNDAAGVIPRLITIGLRPYIIAPALRVVIAQRLVRRLCQNCKKEYKPLQSEIDEFKKELENFFPKTEIKKLYKSFGCPRCHQTGFSGRVGVYEVFENTPQIEKMIFDRASSQEIFEAAKKQGMMTMRQDGFLKVIEGITSVEEVKRVTG